EAAFNKGGTSGWILGGAALLGAGLTAFYMTRLMFMTFLGEKRWADPASPAYAGEGHHPHEAPRGMTGPMILLAVGSGGAGAFFIVGKRMVHWLEPVTGFAEQNERVSGLLLMFAVPALMLAGAALAWAFFGRQPVPAVAPAAVSPVTRAARANLYADAFNETVLMRPGQWVVRVLGWGESAGIGGVA